MPTKTIEANVAATGHHFTDKKEEVYFSAELELPRVGRTTLRYIADRYVARVWGDDPNGPGKDAWTNWRLIRSSAPEVGIGPKTLDAARTIVEPLAMEWLASSAYTATRQKAIARYIARTATDSRYSLHNARELFHTFQAELTYSDKCRLSQALDHLEAGHKMLEGED